MTKVIVLKTGAWDILHMGHLNALEFSAQLGDKLVIGVATDEYINERKGHQPIMPYHERARLVGALQMVDAVAPYNGPEDMIPVELFGVTVKVVDPDYCVGGSEHAQRQVRAREKLRAMGVQIVYLPRTPYISSTKLKGMT